MRNPKATSAVQRSLIATYRRLVVLASMAVALGAHAKECWIDDAPPKPSIQASRGDASVPALDQLARDINAVFHRHATLNSLLDGASPTRLRTRWSVGQIDPATGRRSLWMQLRDHRSEMWVGPCGLSKHADRIEPRASIVVHVDAPDAMLQRRALYDDQLTAWTQPPLTGYAGSLPVFYGWLVVLTADGQLPWVPVSMDEYLQYEARELERAAESVAKNRRDLDANDDAALNKQMLAAYEGMKKFDPAAAERMLADLRAQVPSARAKAQSHAESGERQSRAQLAALRAFRDSLSPEVLASQARLGWTEAMAADAVQRLLPLVKINTAWAGSRGSRDRFDGPRVIGLVIQGRGPYEPAMSDVLRTLNYEELSALTEKIRPGG